MCPCVRVSARACARVCVCLRACVRVFVHARVAYVTFSPCVCLWVCACVPTRKNVFALGMPVPRSLSQSVSLSVSLSLSPPPPLLPPSPSVPPSFRPLSFYLESSICLPFHGCLMHGPGEVIVDEVPVPLKVRIIVYP